MKRFILWTGGTLLLAGGAFAAYAAFQEPTTLPGTKLDGITLGGLTKEGLQRRLDSWWQARRLAYVEPTSHLLLKQPAPMTLAELGLVPDWPATLQQVKFQTFTEGLLPASAQGPDIVVTWQLNESAIKRLTGFVAANGKAQQPARVRIANGTITRNYEVAGYGLDLSKLADIAASTARKGESRFDLPMIEQPPRISKEALDSITEVVSHFTTRFNLGQRNRSSNIKLATSKFDGRILLPGEVISYNETVGQRTVARGFKLAGVYANGRHDTGIGGGICQVSTTLFNAVALANLGIVSRSNHSMPVAYVPVGRDATVDFGSIDLKFKNTFQTPIAISSETKGGSVTFRILGKKTPGLKVTLTTSDHSSWANTLKVVDDPTVAPGKTKIIEKGSMGRRCITWRLVEVNGKVSREKLGISLYRPSARIVARGPAPKPAAPTPTEPDIEPPPPVDGRLLNFRAREQSIRFVAGQRPAKGKEKNKL